MILGIGIDICQINRIKQTLSDRILSEEETKIYNGFKLDSRKIEFLAGRFAVKEAIIKALSYIDEDTSMKNLVVLNDEKKRPYLAEPSYMKKKISISISHEKEYSVGFAVIETQDDYYNKK